MGKGRGVSRESSWRGGLGHLPFGDVVCRGHAQYSVFAPALQKWQLGLCFFFFFNHFVFFVQNLPQLHTHTVIFSPL